MIKQITVKLKNEPGSLQAMLATLAKHEVDLKALSVSTHTPEQGEAAFIPNDTEKAAGALRGGGYELSIQEALGVEMDDRVGGLAAVLGHLAGEGVNVEQIYAFVTRLEGKSLAVLTADDMPKAREALARRGLHLVTRSALAATPREPGEPASLVDHLGLDFIW